MSGGRRVRRHRCGERPCRRAAQSQLPDLVICDIMMPELDGYRVLTQLRQNPVTAIIPFMFITAMTAEAERRLGMYLEDDYLTKPVQRRAY